MIFSIFLSALGNYSANCVNHKHGNQSLNVQYERGLVTMENLGFSFFGTRFRKKKNSYILTEIIIGFLCRIIGRCEASFIHFSKVCL